MDDYEFPVTNTMSDTIIALQAVRAKESDALYIIHFLTNRAFEAYQLPVTQGLLEAWQEDMITDLFREMHPDTVKLFEAEPEVFIQVYVGQQIVQGGVLPCKLDNHGGFIPGPSHRTFLLNLITVTGFTVTKQAKADLPLKLH